MNAQVKEKMMSKYKIIAFFGPSAAGKDTLAKQVCSIYPSTTHFIVSHTTRPPRGYEIDGVDYHFISVEKFTDMVLNYELMEAANYNEWFYGTSYGELHEDKVNVGVFNLEGMKCIMDDPKLEVLPIYVTAADATRLRRSLDRDNGRGCEEICRRFLADKKEFREIPFEYYTWQNEELGFNEAKDLIIEWLFEDNSV